MHGVIGNSSDGAWKELAKATNLPWSSATNNPCCGATPNVFLDREANPPVVGAADSICCGVGESTPVRLGAICSTKRMEDWEDAEARESPAGCSLGLL